MSADRARILVAEDDDELRALIVETLEARYTVVGFEDGYELLDYLALEQRVPRPDLIVTDVCMPGMSGLDVIAEAAVHCPVVLFSAFADKDTRRKAFERGAALFLEKPVDLEELARAIATLLPHPSAP